MPLFFLSETLLRTILHDKNTPDSPLFNFRHLDATKQILVVWNFFNRKKSWSKMVSD